ncbi:hypothetical protein CRU92_03930 [Arcobacter sp. FW59]|nr:hypothetical protein CRU92_03930 [Arcobacter sp. FW59]
MLIYIIFFYISFLVIFEKIINGEVLNYLIVFLISIIISFVFYKILGNPVGRFERYLRKEHKKSYEFSFYFLPEILTIFILLGLFLFLN